MYYVWKGDATQLSRIELERYMIMEITKHVKFPERNKFYLKIILTSTRIPALIFRISENPSSPKSIPGYTPFRPLKLLSETFFRIRVRLSVIFNTFVTPLANGTPLVCKNSSHR